MAQTPLPPRVILLMRATTYRARPFLEAAARLGIEVVKGIDMPPELAEYWHAPLGLQFDQPEQAVEAIVEFARRNPVQAILAVDDSATVLAALASEALGLAFNSSEAALAARNKYRMRQLLSAAGVPCPNFRLYDMADNPTQVAAEVEYPCVVKPLLLSGSRGVIRANNPAEFEAAFRRLGRLLASMQRVPGSTGILVENFIPGFEVALEGMLDRGQLKVLALFDKPDPLDGPFFEETIYVTPSRLPVSVQTEIADCAAQAAAALGLRQGPIHAELRVNETGPWLVEVAGRSIGGLCSQTLRFGPDVSLEELILRQAVGLEIASWRGDEGARGVMMIPIPGAGLLKRVDGVEAARQVPGIESVEITAQLYQPLVPLPEGESYLGFIFARANEPAEVEAALRQAHARLHFEVEIMLPVLQ
ncbi:MAG: phosphoribosylglycinamide synthetase [Anaerolineae bacterium]|nr:ATP-grasp domain-containing protein [Anaerolineales bacterium]MCQ3972164.1 phosphoribosylglycinamide synthetase [Anaerolineae bacterium]